MKRLVVFTVALLVTTAAEALFFRLQNSPLDPTGTLVCAAINSVALIAFAFTFRMMTRAIGRKKSKKNPATKVRCFVLFFMMSVIGFRCSCLYAQAPQNVSVCEADQIAAFRGDSLRLTYFGPYRRTSINWSTSAGEINGDKWTLKGIEASTTLISAKATDGQGNELCRFDVVVLPDETRANRKFTGTGFVTAHDDVKGTSRTYGMYSYLLFVHPQGKDDIKRSRIILEAYFDELTPTLELQRFLPYDRLNIFQLPITQLPNSVSGLNALQLTDWTLAHLDIGFSNALTLSLGGTFTAGPYIVSCSRALTIVDVDHSLCEVQDLSVVPDSMLKSWIRHVEYQAAHQDASFSLQTFALRLRTIIAQIAEDEPSVAGSVQKVLDLRKRVK